MLPILDSRWLKIKFLNLALANSRLTDAHTSDGEKLHLFKQLVEHGTPIPLVKNVQRRKQAEKASQQDEYAVQVTLVRVDLVDVGLQILGLWMLISFQARQHADDFLWINSFLPACLFVTVYVAAIVSISIGL